MTAEVLNYWRIKIGKNREKEPMMAMRERKSEGIFSVTQKQTVCQSAFFSDCTGKVSTTSTCIHFT